MATTKEVLVRARAFIERGHTTMYSARAADGSMVAPDSDMAVCWCAIGALYAVDRDAAMGRPYDVLSSALKSMDPASEGLVATYNDTHSTDEVLRLFDAAIASCDEEPTP
jgi:hypothetical protein